MKVLVTGASGFIGSNLVEALSTDFQVLSPTHADLDLLDEVEVARWLGAHRVDAVVHCATKPGHRNAKDPAGLLDANTRMFANLTRAPEACGRVVLLTSGAVYGQRFACVKVREEDLGARVPRDETGYSKYLCARLAERLPWCVELRPFGVFGPGEDWEIRFISNAICKALFGLPITLRQDRRFDYLWVGDLAPIVRHFLVSDARHAAYNATPDAAVPLRALAEKVRDLSGKPLEIRVGAPGEGLEYSGDNGRLRAELPGLQLTPLDRAIERLWAWYAARRDRIDPARLLHDK